MFKGNSITLMDPSMWKNGKHHGKGILSFYNGNNFEGEWRDGEFIGHVTYVFPDGEYIGGQQDGEPHGNGTFINPDGSTFEGTYNDGEWDGKGTVITSDGCKYVR